LGGESKIHPFMNGLYEANIKTDVVYVGIYDNDVAGLGALKKAGYSEEENNCGFRKLIGDVHPHNHFFAFALIKPDQFTAPCTIESMYPFEKYENALREAFDRSIGQQTNKSIDDINKKIKEDAKNILAENSKNFVKADFENFKKIFDLILTINKKALQSNNSKPVISKIGTAASTSVVGDVNARKSSNEIKKEFAEPTEPNHAPVNSIISKSINEPTASEDDHLRNKDEAIIKLYLKYKQAILNLDSQIKVIPKKTYIAFKKKTNIVDIEIQEKNIKIWINLKIGDLYDPLKLTRNVSILKGHNGNGDYELLVSEKSDLDYITELVKQAIEKQ